MQSPVKMTDLELFKLYIKTVNNKNEVTNSIRAGDISIIDSAEHVIQFLDATKNAIVSELKKRHGHTA